MKKLVITLVLFSLILLLAASAIGLAEPAGGTYTGTAFRDYNANGSRDAGEPGIQGLAVTAYDSAGAAQGTTTTDATGAYSLVAAGTGPYRIEFTNIPAYLRPGAVGSNSATSVQFVADGGATAVDVGFNNPADYAASDARLTTNIYYHADRSGTNPALISFDYDSGCVDANLNGSCDGGGSFDTPAPTTEATQPDIGTTWGLAYDASTDSIYASAFMKRHTQFRNYGETGMIYRIQNSTTTLYADFSTQTGTDPHVQYNSGTNQCTGGLGTTWTSQSGSEVDCWDHDPDSWDQVGRIGFGDIDISDDLSTLWTINLATRELYRIPVTTSGLPLGVSDITAYALPLTATCQNTTDLRPFALAFHDDVLYVGMTCTAETSQDQSELQAFVYSMDAATPGTFTLVLSIPLTYNRSFAIDATIDSDADWNPWSPTFTYLQPPQFNSGEVAYPQPWLADIEFDGDDMILGVRDRYGDQMGFRRYDTNYNNNSTLYSGDGAGDILKACADGLGGWTLENNGSCGGNSTGGSNNSQGPGGGEFYYQEHYPYHSEISMSGLVNVPGRGETVETAYDTIYDTNQYFDGGIVWLDNTSGQRNRAYRIYDTSPGGTNPGDGTFAKGNGLGDMEYLSDPAPLEIGNRVWCDADTDGLQDPGESGVGTGVNVVMTCGVQSATVATDTSGNYLFTDVIWDASANTTSSEIPRNTSCTIAIDTTGGNGTVLTTACGGTGLSPADQTPVGDGNDDIRDSDGTLVGDNSEVTFTTGGAGENDHTYDFGFAQQQTGSITIIKDAVPDDAQDFSFTATGTTPANFDLDDDADGTLSNQQVFSSLTDGSYTFTEVSIPSGWGLTNIVCAGATNSTITIGASGGFDAGDTAVTVGLSDGEDIICTFTNTPALIDLQLTKTAVPPSNVGPGDTVIYTLTLVNNSDVNATGVIVEDVLPPGVTYVSDNGGGDTNQSGGTVTWTVGNLAAQNTVTLEITVTVTVTLAAANIGLTAPSVVNIGSASSSVANSGLTAPSATNIGSAAPFAGTITGTVYRDYNANGAQDANELGLSSVNVTAYDSAGAAQGTTTTIADGSYSLTATGTGPYRIEFTLPADGSMDAMKPGPAGQTTVQFVADGDVSDVNVGFHNPSTFTQADPLLFTPKYIGLDNINGEYSTSEYVSAAVVYSANSTTPTYSYQVPAEEMGATYGVAWQANSQMLFTSSYVKNGAGLGPNASGVATTGGIYLVTPTTVTEASASLFIDLFPIVNTGADPHPAPTDTCTSGLGTGTTNKNCWFHDGATVAAAGKLGLGDLDFNADHTVLYTVNLIDGKLVEMPVGNPAVAPTPGSVLTYDTPTGDCADGDAQPFALATHKTDPDKMYVGVTCSAETSQNPAELWAWIYLFDRGTGPGTESYTAVFNNTLNYARPRSTGSWGVCLTPGVCPATWRPWQDNLASMYVVDQNSNGVQMIVVHPQPMLSDIVFDGNDLILGIRDREADQIASRLGKPDDNTSTALWSTWAAGDMVRACDDGAGGWTMESNGVCGGVTGAGAGNTDGYGGGEYYFDYYELSSDGYHTELSNGGLAQAPGFSSVAATSYDRYDVNEGLIGTWKNLAPNAGTPLTGARIYQHATLPTFVKANGLGDLEILSDPAPLEIGNRLWCDTDNDGLQDPDESDVGAGVDVVMTCGVQSATVSTDANGNYLFTDAIWDASANTTTSEIPRDTSCIISIDTTGGNGTVITTACGGTDLSPADQTPVGDGNDDIRDSDGALVGNNSQVTFTTGGAGENDHTFDFGFMQQTIGDLSITKAVTGGTSTETFTITLDCSDDNFDDANIQLTHGGMHTVADIPTGTTCTVAELAQPAPPAGFAWGAAVITPAQPVTIEDGTTVAVTVTNPLQASCDISAPTLLPTCSDNGTPSDAGDDTFTFTVLATGTATGASYSISATGLVPNPTTGLQYGVTEGPLGGPFAISGGNLPVTLTDETHPTCTESATVIAPATCSAGPITNCSEVSAADQDDVDSTPDNMVGTTVAEDDEFCVTITQQASGSLEIVKDVTGEPTPFTSPTFDIVVDCSDDAFDQTVHLADGGSTIISGIPENTTCIVTEPTQPAPPAGYAYAAPVITPSPVTIGDGTTVTVTVTNPLQQQELEFGDAPEVGVAYPSIPVPGAFPTCMTVGTAGWIQHNNFGAHFGPTFEFEADGNAGLCPNCFPNYDDDECFQDGDAGLIIPEPFTIDPNVNVIPCPNFAGSPLGNVCQTATWGGNVDIEVHNHMPNQTVGYVNVLMDWNQDGQWALDPATTCGGTAVPEHVLVDFQIPNPYDGPLSALTPPGFTIGPNTGHVWTRFSITERPIGSDNWNGEGSFEDGETEDYLLRVDGLTLGDLVWYDQDQDGIQDTGEPGVNGVDAALFNNATCTGTATANTTTANGGTPAHDGWYEFADLAAGSYCVEFSSIPTGWTVSPQNAGTDDAVDSDPDTTTHQIQNISLTADDPNEDMGIYQDGTVGDTVWCESATNPNTAFDPVDGDAGINNITVTLYEDFDCDTTADGAAIGTTTTANGGTPAQDGYYQFTGLEVAMTGDTNQTCYVVEVDATDTDLGACSTPITPIVDNPDLDSDNPDDPTNDFGFQQLYKLGDLVWYDQDQDGIQDGTEPGVNGVNAALFNNATCTGTATANTSTANGGTPAHDGWYEFTGLVAGSYCVEFSSIPTGWTVSPQNAGTDDTIDSDPDTTTHQIQNITLGPDDPNEDMGIYQDGTVGDTVWCESATNANTSFDPGDGDAGINNVTVTLYEDFDCDTTADGAAIGTATTANGGTPAQDGFYQFTGLQVALVGDPNNQTCYVVEVDETDTDLGACNDPITDTEDNPDLDTDNPDDPTNDFGFQQLYKLGDLVWYDQDQDGIQDTGELGVNSVNAALYNNATCTGTATANTSTANGGTPAHDGWYEFTGLVAGSYCVEFSSIPTGWTVSPQNAGTDDTIDSDPDTTTHQIQNITLGPDDPNEDMGIYQDGTVGDTVWCESATNANTSFDPGDGDAGINNVTVTLYEDFDCDTTADGAAIGTATTANGGTPAQDGFYQFTGLQVALVGDPNNQTCYVVEVDETDTDLGACNDPITDTEDNPDLDTDNPDDPTNDFGFQKLYDWGDLPDSFDTTTAETGPNHIIVSDLYLGSCVDAEADGQVDATGHAGVAGGGSGNGDDGNAGTATGTCTAADDEDGVTLVTPLIPGAEACVEIDAVNTGAAVTLYGWIDFDGDGQFDGDANEFLTFTSGGTIATGGATDQRACFDVPASATLEGGETHMRYRLTRDTLAAANWGDAAADGEVEDYWQPLACIGNFVWDDRTGDTANTQDANDTPLTGLEMRLVWGGPDGVINTDASDATAQGDDRIYLTNTDGNGVYNFCGLTPDDYRVEIPTTPDTAPEAVTPNSGTDDVDDSDGVQPASGDPVDGPDFTIPDPISLPLAEDSNEDNPGAINNYPDAQDDLTLDFGFLSRDWGDLPDSFDTTTAETGPNHIIVSSLYLGSCVDGETDGVPTADATGDDVAVGSPVEGTCTGDDDEDGVTLVTPLIPGAEACVEVDAVNTGADVTLYGWIDFDGDGQFDGDANEFLTFTSGGTIATGGATNQQACFTVPAGATFDGGETHMRFRLTRDTLAAANWGDAAADGEVEDYWQPLACIGNFVWDDRTGDTPNTQDANDTGIAGVEMRLVWGGPNGVIDTDASDATAQGDDRIYITNTDGDGRYEYCGLTPDDYRVEIPTPPDTASEAVTPNSGTNDVDDSDGVQPATGDPVDGPDFTIPDPIALPTGENSNQDNPGAINNYPDAQDDLTFDFGFLARDWGDLPDIFDTTSVETGPNHIIVSDLYLGSCVDGEANGQPDYEAGVDGTNGDDNNVGTPVEGTCTNNDDEDGVTLVTPLVPGAQACVTINAVNTGAPATLYGWIDFNGDGNFDSDNNEFLFFGASGTIATGGATNHQACFNVPASATFDGGETHMRFRLTRDNLTNMDWGGAADDGEVEDYWLQLACMGNYVWDDSTGTAPDVQDGNDMNFNGVGVRLVWGGLDDVINTDASDGMPQGDDRMYTTSTDTNGRYEFCGLLSDTYRVEIPTPPAAAPLAVTPNQGGDDVLDSDGVQSGGAGGPVDGPDFTIPAPPTTLSTGEYGRQDNPGMINNFPDGQDELTMDFGFLRMDWGDLPDGFDTTIAHLGPYHIILSDLYLGACVDGEGNGQPDAQAGLDGTGGDDNLVGSLTVGTCINNDDEDGVKFTTPLIAGAEACIEVDALNTGAPATLYGWIDFNGDGDFFTDANELLNTGDFAAGGYAVNSSLTDQKLCFTVPAVATFNGGETHMRFRLTRDTLTASDWRGAANSGEVEDYWRELACVGNYVWGDTYGTVSNIQDTGGDIGLSSVGMRLVWGGPDGVIDTDASDGAAQNDDRIYTTNTNADGAYDFCGLTPDAYRVEIPTPPAAAPLAVTPNQGGNDVLDSDGVQNNIGDPVDGPNFTIPDPPTTLVTDENGNQDNPGGLNNFPDAQDDITYDFGFKNLPSSYTIEKSLTSGTPSRPGEEVIFDITITNTGETWLAVVPMKDEYDTEYLTYGYQGQFATQNSVDNTNDGTINWSDLTVSFGQDLEPLHSFVVTVHFTAVKDTTILPSGVTVNTATVTDALADLDGPNGPLVPDVPLPDQADNAEVEINQPTGLAMASFAARSQGVGVFVSWETLSELDMLGFNVQRSVGYGEFETLNTELIVADHAGSDAGSAYDYFDTEVQPAEIYQYRLEIIKLDGSSVVYGLSKVAVLGLRPSFPSFIY